MPPRGRDGHRLTAAEWTRLADMLEMASAEQPTLIGFRVCETAARALSAIRKLEADTKFIRAVLEIDDHLKEARA